MKQNGYVGVVLLIILAFVGTAIIATALNIITIPWLKLNRRVDMEREIVAKTYDADNALYNYRWFKDRYEEIKATEGKIENAEQDITNFERSSGNRSTWTFEDKNEYSRLISVRTGLKNYYETIVGEYNSRAKQVDRAIFKDELPLFFTIKPF